MRTKILTFFISAMMISVLSYSQGGQDGQGQGRRDFDPEEMAKKNTDAMKERLELTETQLTKVEKINLTAANKMKDTFDNAMGDREAMRSSMMKVNEETNKELKAVLTAAQWEEYEVMQKERREQMKRRAGGTDQ
jgi:hypothetical protein